MLHIGSSDINHKNVEDIDNNKIDDGTINIAEKCSIFGVKGVAISSIFLKRQFKLKRVTRQVNGRFICQVYWEISAEKTTLFCLHQ